MRFGLYLEMIGDIFRNHHFIALCYHGIGCGKHNDTHTLIFSGILCIEIGAALIYTHVALLSLI